MPYISIGRPSNAHSCRLKHILQRVRGRLERRSSAGRGSFDEILFNFAVVHGDRMVIRWCFGIFIIPAHVSLGGETRTTRRNRWGWREREREREYNRLLVAWFEFAEVQGTMCDCLK